MYCSCGSSRRTVWLLCLALLMQSWSFTSSCNTSQTVEFYIYNVVAEYPHDPDAFTQGLQFDHYCDDDHKQCHDIFWESTGLHGRSSVRMVDLATGRVLQTRALEHQWFGEGLAKLGSKLYQITWQTPTGFIYSADSRLQLLGSFKTPLRDGWGLTSDGKHLVVTDGSARITWLDPETLAEVRSVQAKDGDRPIIFLNELEWIDGELWANVWQTDCIARICPQTGQVKGWVLMHGLRSSLQERRLPQATPMDVLNGIAHDAASNRTFVTGKLWPRLFEVQVQRVPAHRVHGSKKLRQRRQSCFPQGWIG